MKRLGLVALLLLVACLSSAVCAETVYFLVAEMSPYYHDSYVLPLTDPCDITHARNLIEYGPGIGGALVVASIDHWDPNNGINTNREYLQPGVPAWSWYVTEFMGFAELSAEVCDGWPGLTELGSGAGQICFWSYTVVAELGTDLEPWNCDLTVDGIVDPNDLAWLTSHWLDSGCGHRYYCEGTDINGSGEVDFYDFAIFANHWLWEE